MFGLSDLAPPHGLDKSVFTKKPAKEYTLFMNSHELLKEALQNSRLGTIPCNTIHSQSMNIEFTAIAFEEYKDPVEYYNIQEAWQYETVSTRRFLLK